MSGVKACFRIRMQNGGWRYLRSSRPNCYSRNGERTDMENETHDRDRAQRIARSVLNRQIGVIDAAHALLSILRRCPEVATVCSDFWSKISGGGTLENRQGAAPAIGPLLGFWNSVFERARSLNAAGFGESCGYSPGLCSQWLSWLSCNHRSVS